MARQATTKKTFVIGDIHGCHETFERLLGKISPVAGEDTIVILGDMINRGPESKEVIETLIKLRHENHQLITLKGNHEVMFLDYLSGKNRNFFLVNGGEMTLKSYGIADPFSKKTINKIPADHIKFLRNLLPYWQDETYIYVHAGLKPGIKLTKQPNRWLYWAKKDFIEEQHDYGKKVIFGHTTFKEPLIQKSKVGIDTGAAYGNKLTCLILPDFEFISVNAP